MSLIIGSEDEPNLKLKLQLCYKTGECNGLRGDQPRMISCRWITFHFINPYEGNISKGIILSIM